MKEEIIRYAKEIGIDVIGFCDANTQELQEIIRLRKERGLTCAFESDYVEARELLSNVETVISVGVSYPLRCDIKDNKISNSSWGIDYHILLNEKMMTLVTFIKSLYNNLSYRVLVDNHPLNDKYFARKAGLGFLGKNNLIINEEWGSNIFIGTILTNLDVEHDKEKKSLCGPCTKCLDACPTKALGDGPFNSTRCRSYLTQKKELTTEEEKEIKMIYGCDICGLVCPFNHKQSKGEILKDKLVGIAKIKKMSNQEFKREYGNMALSWRGKKILIRNMDLANKNK